MKRLLNTSLAVLTLLSALCMPLVSCGESQETPPDEIVAQTDGEAATEARDEY